MNGLITREEAEALLFREARLLDENQLDDWLELVSEDFVYWIPVNRDDVDPAQHLSIVHETKPDCTKRVFRVLESGLNHPQEPPSRTARLVSNVEVFGATRDDEATVRCNLLLCEFRPHGQRRGALQRHQHVARCEYRVRRVGADDLRITYKKVAFVDLDAPLEAMTYFL